jgi:superfamily II DNA helicase RecQ
MPVHIITLPFDPETEMFHDEELSRFLLNKRVVTLRPEFFLTNGRPYWSVFVEYETVLSASDDRIESNNLDEPQRLLLQRLKEWRKEKAAAEGVPVYILATNSQLVDLIKQTPQTLESLRQIHGFGRKKCEKYGADIIGIIHAFYEKKPPHAENTTNNPDIIGATVTL